MKGVEQTVDWQVDEAFTISLWVHAPPGGQILRLGLASNPELPLDAYRLSMRHLAAAPFPEAVFPALVAEDVSTVEPEPSQGAPTVVLAATTTPTESPGEARTPGATRVILDPGRLVDDLTEDLRSFLSGGEAPPGLVGLPDEAYAAVTGLLLEEAGSLPEAVAPPWAPPPEYPNVEVPRVTRQIPLDQDTTTDPDPGRGRSGSSGWQLRWTVEPNAGQEVALGERVRLGREPDNDILVEGAGISRHHAVIEWVGEGYQITDLGSVNGTLVNGQRVAVPNAVCRACGTLLVGSSKFCGKCGARLSADDGR